MADGRQSPDDEHEDETVRVVVRVRPLTDAERDSGEKAALLCLDDQRTVHIDQPPGEDRTLRSTGRVVQSYSLDASIPPDASQGVFFDRCGIKPMLHSVLNGFAATCFAYGQTGSGKTYSLIGPESNADKLDKRSSEHDGLLSRAVKFLFSEIKRRQGVEHVVEVSYCEIYNERVRDLLHEGAGAAGSQPLPVRYNPHEGFYVDGLTTIPCSSKAEVMSCFCRGFGKTRVASHDMNMRSNRSHCIFSIHVHITGTESKPLQVAHGKMCFVDLAGSERACHTHATGKTLAESGQINKSLFVLGKVIAALTARAKKGGGRGVRVPYRDSTLTRLLMSSLGGHCKTLMVTCCSPSPGHISESLRSLQFASRAKNIRNRPVIILDAKESLIQELKKELAKLRRENQHLQDDLAKNRTALRASQSSLASQQKHEVRGQDAGLSGSAPRDPRREKDTQEPDSCLEGHTPSVGGDVAAGREQERFASLVNKTRYVLEQHRRKALPLRYGGNDGETGEEENEGERDVGVETERDAQLMQELRSLMHEYNEQQARKGSPCDAHGGTPTPPAIDTLAPTVASAVLGVLGGQVAGDEDVNGLEEEQLAWEQWEQEDEDLLEHVLDDDEDQATDILDVWSADKGNALEEMRMLEKELAAETGQRPSYMNVKQSLVDEVPHPPPLLASARTTLLRPSILRPASAAARPFSDRRVQGDRPAQQTEWSEIHDRAWPARIDDAEVGMRQGGMHREYQPGQPPAVGTKPLRQRPSSALPASVAIKGAGTLRVEGRAGLNPAARSDKARGHAGKERGQAGGGAVGPGADRRDADFDPDDAERLLAARREAIRATMGTLNGWGVSP